MKFNTQNKLRKIADALTKIDGLKVYHYTRKEDGMELNRYCVWSEDIEGGSFQTSNHKAEMSLQGTVDLFTKIEFDEYVDAIHEALDEIEICAWRYDSADYEDDTGFIHHQWIFEVA